jgi:superfamily II DNA helicase RecQ
MRLKVFTLRYSPASEGFDDHVLSAFLADKEALSVHEHFFVHEQVPTWALLVSYRELTRPGDRERERAREQTVDHRAELGPDEQRLFDALRTWRNERARREGKPAYLLFTNRQLAELVRLRPTTLAALHAIDGLGEARTRDFGPDLVALIATQPGPPPPAATPAPEAPRAGG